MKVAVILNGISRKKKIFYRIIYPLLQEKSDVTVFETQYPNHAKELAAQAVALNFEIILAAGGDGTLHQVLNGILTAGASELPSLGIIPLGTGNDFAKLCGFKPGGNNISGLLELNKPIPTDIGKISCINENGEPVTEYFINACSIGMGPDVVKRLQNSDRALGPLLTYLKAIIATFFTHQPQPLSVDAIHWQWSGNVRVFAVANGVSFGNSMYIAPDARPDDELLNTFLVGEVRLLKFLGLLQKIKTKTKINSRQIEYNSCTSLKLTSGETTLIEAEGELAGRLPAKIEVLPRMIKFFR